MQPCECMRPTANAVSSDWVRRMAKSVFPAHMERQGKESTSYIGLLEIHGVASQGYKFGSTYSRSQSTVPIPQAPNSVKWDRLEVSSRLS